MKSFSQAGQDLFVSAVLGGDRDAEFLDVGCGNATLRSNTAALETDLGWRGLLLDGNEECVEQCRRERKSQVVCADATTYDFCQHWGNRHDIAYLSLDVDEAQEAALRNVLECARVCKVRFKVLTVETDFYRYGQARKDALYKLLTDAKYLCIADDVKHEGFIFESFWIDPTIESNMARARPFISTGLDWRDVLKQGGVEP